MTTGGTVALGDAGFGPCWSCRHPLGAQTPACPSCGARLLVGEQYRVVRELGHGGMGVVYEATDLGLGRAVALKLMHPRLGADPAQRARFEMECRAMAALDHPAIARIHAIGRHGEQIFIVQELIRGSSLGAWIQAAKLDQRAALAITRELLGAMAHAHARGVVHRDVNPNNVLVVGTPPDLMPKIVDFGMARLDAGDVHTRTAWGGTSGFAAPEQILEASSHDRRSDLYAAGAVLFTMLTGGRTAWGDTFRKESVTTPAALVAAYAKLTRGELGELDTHRLVVRAPAIEAWLKRALAIDPERRFQDAASMRDALDAAALGVFPPAAATSSGTTRAPGADVAAAQAEPPPGATLAGGWSDVSRPVAPRAEPSAHFTLPSRARRGAIATAALATVTGVGVAGWWAGRAELPLEAPPAANVLAAPSVRDDASLPAPAPAPAGPPFDVPVAIVALAEGGLAVADAGLHRIVVLDDAGGARVLAGGTEPGFADGPGGAARFSTPAALAQHPDGSILVADLANRRLRSIRDGVVSTLAGDGTDECVDGSLASARFRAPIDVVVTPHGEIYVADADANAVRIVSNGSVRSVGGPSAGHVDGPLASARFSRPSSLALLADGSVAVDDAGNGAVRVLRGDRVETRTTPRASAPPARSPLPHYLRGLEVVVHRRRMVPDGDLLLVTDPVGASIRKWVGATDATWLGDGRPGFDDGPSTEARVMWPLDLVARGDVAWIADPLDRAVRRVEAGKVTTVARSPRGAFADGDGSSARFRWPRGIAVASDGSMMIADPGNARVRRIDAHAHVTTLAGAGDTGSVDADVADATFVLPDAVAWAPEGSMVVADRGARRVREIRDGRVTTLAGSGAIGRMDGPALAASFGSPEGIAIAPDGTIYVADASSHAIRTIAHGHVTTFAGGGQAGFTDGTASGATFAFPTAVAVAKDGTVFVADAGNGAIRAIHEGHVRTIAGDGRVGFRDGPANEARFDGPSALAVAADGAIFVADEGNHRIRRVFEGRVSTVVGSSTFGFRAGDVGVASLARPAGLALDAAGRLWITDAGAQRVAVLESGVLREMAGGE